MLKDEFLVQIGRVVTGFSYLDTKIDEALWGILNLSDEQGRSLTGKIASPSTRIEMLFNFIRQSSPDEAMRNHANELEEKLKKLNTRRNMAAHAVWWQVPSDDFFAQCQRYKIGALKQDEPEEWNYGKLLYTANEIEQVTLDPLSFAIQAKPLVQASLGRS